MITQSTFMVVAPIREGSIDSLRTLLASMNLFAGHADPHNNLLPFAKFEQLHMARFIIIESLTADEIEAFGVTARPWDVSLAFIGDIDGDRDSFLAELCEKVSPGLEKIFNYCDGFTAGNTHLLKWMKTHHVKPAANYVNWIGRTVKQVHEEAELHQSLSDYLKTILNDNNRDDPRDLRQLLLSHVELEKHAGRLTLTPIETKSCIQKITDFTHKLSIPLLLLFLSPLFILIAPLYFLRIRMLERSDPELFIRPSREHIQKLSLQEDHYVSNQFNVFGDVKPGIVRLLTFKFILFLVSYLTRHIYNKGFLTRIKTIHFARWVFLDNNRKAFFASNYDGSHESYMDDFINKAGWGLNLSFGSSVGYPTTRWLFKQGALREQQFKYTQRRHQFPSEVWYKAYPDLTTVDLARNTRIRNGVDIRQSGITEIREWLSLI